MPIISLIRLTRPANLGIVLVTMLVVRLFVIMPMAESTRIGMKYGISWWLFAVLCLVAVFLTAAGNVINDYFDQKVDRINKPQKVIVGKTVKRRAAIIMHQTLNGLALLLALYICMFTSYWWPLVIPVVVSTLLWWYSPILKKKLLLGNLTVALCTAAVPFWAAIFELQQLQKNYGDLLYNSRNFFAFIWLIIIALCAFAFLLTLVREAQKDMEDLEGDKEGGYQTLPIIVGTAKTKLYVYCLLSVYIICVLSFTYYIIHAGLFSAYIAICSAALLLLPAVLSFIQTIKAHTAAQFHKASVYSKWMMLAGLTAFCLLSYFY